jgi:putative membrane protein
MNMISDRIDIALTTLLTGVILNAFLSIVSRVIADSLSLIFFLIFILLAYQSFWRDVWKIFVIGALTGFIFELLGVNTGIPFGRYEYTGFPTSMIIGVPFPIIFAWGNYLTITYLLTAYITERYRPLICASLMATLDMAIDPIMVNRGLWVWMDNSNLLWFGIPITNFVGWFVVSMIACIIYEKMGAGIRNIEGRRKIPIIYFSQYIAFIFISNLNLLVPILSSITVSLSIIYISYTLTRKSP